MMSDNNVLRIDTNAWQNDFNTPSMVEVKIDILDLVPNTDAVLREKIDNFDFSNPPVDPNTFASSLVETCRKHNALGLSANQCGFKHRVFVMGFGDSYVAFFNPEITKFSEELTKLEEGCLSFKDLFLNIERPASIEVTYQDFTGEWKTSIFAGLTARCFQHELDHLNGVCYTEKMKPLALQLAQKKMLKLTQRRTKLKKNMIKTVKAKFNAKKFGTN